jgi:hypothetical protein
VFNCFGVRFVLESIEATKFFFMQTNRKKAAKKGVENSGFDSAQNSNPGSKKARIQNHHRSATYAASMWHSAVQYVKPQNHSGIDL